MYTTDVHSNEALRQNLTSACNKVHCPLKVVSDVNKQIRRKTEIKSIFKYRQRPPPALPKKSDYHKHPNNFHTVLKYVTL